MISQRISLSRIIALNWYGFRQVFEVTNHTLIAGAFGTGKTALLDLIQHGDFYDLEKKILLLTMSRFDLADYLGTSPETVARALSRLEKDNLVTRISPRQLFIPNPELLGRLLQVRRRSN